MRRPAWLTFPMLVWLSLLIALVAISWQMRYAPIRVHTNDRGVFTYVWDRWMHRTCVHVVTLTPKVASATDCF